MSTFAAPTKKRPFSGSRGRVSAFAPPWAQFSPQTLSESPAWAAFVSPQLSPSAPTPNRSARPPALPAKLAIGGESDAFEKEADRVAEAVAGGSLPSAPTTLQHRSDRSGAPSGNVPPIVQEVLGTPGRPLNPVVRRHLEPRFGVSFGDVRVHDDGQAGRSARAVGARAFTSGRDIVFGPGEYAPHSTEGKRVVAHELAHVVQQRANHLDLPSARPIQRLANPDVPTPPAKESDAGTMSDEGLAQEIVGLRQWLADNPASSEQRIQNEASLRELESEAARRMERINVQKQQRSDARAAGGSGSSVAAAGVAVASPGIGAFGGGATTAGGATTTATATGASAVGLAASSVAAFLLVFFYPRSTVSGDEERRQLDAARAATEVAAITVLAIQGPRLAGQVRNVGRHLARLLALGAVGGVPSGEPPKNDNRNDKHWWKEVLASLKQIQQAIGSASRKQVLRELLKQGITEGQIDEIATGLSEAAKMIGEDVPRFLP